MVQQRAGVHLKGGVGEAGDASGSTPTRSPTRSSAASRRSRSSTRSATGGPATTAVQLEEEVGMMDVMFKVALENHQMAVSIFANLTYTQQKQSGRTPGRRSRWTCSRPTSTTSAGCS